MSFIQIPPPAHLRDYVKYFWTLEEGETTANSKTFKAIADGCPGIMFQHPDQGSFHMDSIQLPEIFLYGQSTRPLHLSLNGKFKAFGVFLYPNAVKSIFGLNPGELTDTCTGLNRQTPYTNHYLAEQLSGGRKSQVEVLSDFLVSQIRKHEKDEDKMMQYALSRIIQSVGSLSIKELQSILHVTERTFERRFRQYIGISPKLFSRICRFQASLAQLRGNRFSKLSDIAFENNYADQSHLIRSFHEFAGISPNQYQKQYLEVVENFTEIPK